VPCWTLVVQMCPNGGSLHKVCTKSRSLCRNAPNRHFRRFMHASDRLPVLHLRTPTSLNLPRLAAFQGPPVACGRSGWSRLAGTAQSILFGLKPYDARTLALATALLVAVTAAASYLAARRAAHLEPMAALREQ